MIDHLSYSNLMCCKPIATIWTKKLGKKLVSYLIKHSAILLQKGCCSEEWGCRAVYCWWLFLYKDGILLSSATFPIITTWQLGDNLIMIMGIPMRRADSRLMPSQWETLLQSNAVSHWLGANLRSALYTYKDGLYIEMGPSSHCYMLPLFAAVLHKKATDLLHGIASTLQCPTRLLLLFISE